MWKRGSSFCGKMSSAVAAFNVEGSVVYRDIRGDIWREGAGLDVGS